MQTPQVDGHRTHLIAQVAQHVEAIGFYQHLIHLVGQTAPQPARVKEADEALVAVSKAPRCGLAFMGRLLLTKSRVNVGERLPRLVLKQVLLLEVLGRDVSLLPERALIECIQSLFDVTQRMIDALCHRGGRGHSPFFRQPIVGRSLLLGGERGRPAIARDATANEAQPFAARLASVDVEEDREGTFHWIGELIG